MSSASVQKPAATMWPTPRSSIGKASTAMPTVQITAP